MTSKSAKSAASKSTANRNTKTSTRKSIAGPITLSIDIGGSGLKAMLLDASGRPVSERQRVPTPSVPTPLAVLKGLDKLRALLPRLRPRLGRLSRRHQARHYLHSREHAPQVDGLPFAG